MYSDILKNAPRVDFNIDTFNKLILEKGVIFTHFESLLCPNIQSLEEHTHHDSDCMLNCEDGFMYIEKGLVYGVFSADKKQVILENMGEYDDNTALVTMNTFYANRKDEKVILNVYDKLKLISNGEVLKRYNEYIEHNFTGVDRLSIEPYAVDRIITKSGKIFSQNVHFVISDGLIKWIGQDRPSIDTKIKRGEIYSISYYYEPVYFVKNILHEIRISQTLRNKEPITTQFPMQVELFRDFIYDNPNDRIGGKSSRSPRRYGRIPS